MRAYILGGLLAVMSLFVAASPSYSQVEAATCAAPSMPFTEALAELAKEDGTPPVTVNYYEGEEQIARLRKAIGTTFEVDPAGIVDFDAHAFAFQEGNPTVLTLLINDGCVFKIGKLPVNYAEAIIKLMDGTGGI